MCLIPHPVPCSMSVMGLTCSVSPQRAPTSSPPSSLFYTLHILQLSPPQPTGQSSFGVSDLDEYGPFLSFSYDGTISAYVELASGYPVQALMHANDKGQVVGVRNMSQYLVESL